MRSGAARRQSSRPIEKLLNKVTFRLSPAAQTGVLLRADTATRAGGLHRQRSVRASGRALLEEGTDIKPVLNFAKDGAYDSAVIALTHVSATWTSGNLNDATIVARVVLVGGEAAHFRSAMCQTAWLAPC